MTRLREIIDSYDNPDDWLDIDSICEELYIADTWQFEMLYFEKGLKLRQIPFDTWVCWDTPVGQCALVLDDEIVAITVKKYRKSNTMYHWTSFDAVKKTKDYINSFVKDEPEKFKYIKFGDGIPIVGDQIGKSREANYRGNSIEEMA